MLLSPSSFKTKARRGKDGSDCRFVCLCFEIWSPKPLFPFFWSFFCTLFLMIESKEQANRSSICLIENYTKQIVVVYIQKCMFMKKKIWRKKKEQYDNRPIKKCDSIQYRYSNKYAAESNQLVLLGVEKLFNSSRLQEMKISLNLHSGQKSLICERKKKGSNFSSRSG